jgi:hypothetical protein
MRPPPLGCAPGCLVTLSFRYTFLEERGFRFGSVGGFAVDLWNADTGERVHRLLDGGDRNVMFTADGDLVCDGAGVLHPVGGAPLVLKGDFHLLDPLTGRLLRSFEKAPMLPGASGRYNAALGIAPNGRSICCAGNDGVIHVYETATGKIRRSLVRQRDYVSGLAFTSDGRRLVSASYDLTALVWDVSLAGFHASSRGPLTAEEQAKLWNKLLEVDAAASYEAMAALATRPKVAVALIKAGVKKVVTGPDEATLDRLVAQLGGVHFCRPGAGDTRAGSAG